MNVLFVALGATRRPAVARESARVVADGGSATVLVRKPSAWARDPFADGVDTVELPELERHYRPAAARILLYRIPRLLLRAGLPAPLRGVRRRLDSAYRRRVAGPVDRPAAPLLPARPRRGPAAGRPPRAAARPVHRPGRRRGPAVHGDRLRAGGRHRGRGSAHRLLHRPRGAPGPFRQRMSQ
ncbi:hypothetical protein LUX33_24220 [Actinomadura madurae]|uniref:hypothetical protein n=1 Tax=Actinomadura madurae TaxID=1993 RepID=UPI0020D2352F|nr:hypothetical protein [Actinomadura madurae]MCP9951222.1 hypothetical protein [Actinomadura madurae]